MRRLWTETEGAIVSSELVLVSALMVAGLVSSLTALRDAIIGELEDITTAISELDQDAGLRPDEVWLEGQPNCTIVVSTKAGTR